MVKILSVVGKHIFLNIIIYTKDPSFPSKLLHVASWAKKCLKKTQITRL